MPALERLHMSWEEYLRLPDQPKAEWVDGEVVVLMSPVGYDHGGVVIGSSQTTDTHGKRIARVGDQVTCPKKGHGGTTVIVSGDPTMIIDGQPAARHGDKCACGATLISGQAVSSTT